MKKWLDKTWAKVTAFCLLLVFTALSVAGGGAIAWLVSENAYADGGQIIYERIYGNDCEAALCDVVGYLQSAEPPFMIPPTSEYAEMFAQDHQDWHYALTVTSTDGTVLLDNGRTTDSTYFASRTYTVNGTTVTVTAAADSSRIGLNFEDALQVRLIRWRYALIAIEVLCLAAWLFFLVFSLASSGHWRGHEGIHLTWFDKIPLDLWLAVGLLLGVLLGASGEFDYYFWSYLYPYPFLALCVLLLYLLLIAFAAQCKAGTVLKGSAIAWVLRLLRRAVRWIVYVLRRIPLVWKTALGVAALLFFDLICVMNGHDEEYLFVMLAVHLLAGFFLIYLAIGLRKLQKGGRSLASGNYDSPVDTHRLFGDFRRHGEDLNAAQKGLQLAVDQQMRSERMKTELITNVSHDIKTPLTSIVNYVDLLKKTDITDPAALEYIDVLDRQSQRLRKLTEDLVDASKAASGAVPVNLSDTDVNVFLSQVVGEYRQRLSDCQVEPVLTLEESEPHIRADGKLLWRVLDNLLGNVCKYAMPGTRVYLSSEIVSDQVFLTVKNISRYPLNVSADELTERFVRGDASRSTEGSGLGLSIAMGLTRLQKGQFQLSVDGDLFKAQITFDRL